MTPETRNAQVSPSGMSAVVVPTHPRTLPELAPVFLKWFSLIRRRSDNTVRGYQTDLASFLSFCAQAGLVEPDQVRVQHVEFFMGWLHEHRGLQPASVNRHLHALRSFWKWMHREELTTRNPAAQAFLLKQPKRLPAYLTLPQQDRLFSVLARNQSPAGVRDYALHAVLGLAGLRCSEVSSLRLGDLDLADGVLQIVQGKGRKDRQVPVVPALAEILRHYLEDVRSILLRDRVSDYVFVRASHGWATKHEGRPLGQKTVFYIVRKTLRRVLGIDHGHPHQLRHSFARRIREHGGTIQDLQEVLGHTNIATTARYSSLVTTSQRDRVSKLIEGTGRPTGDRKPSNKAG